MESRGRGCRGRPRGVSQAPPVFDQEAFVEAMGVAAAAIAQAGAVDSQGGIDDIRGIRDMGVGTKRKEYPSSSNPGKKQKTSVSQGYPRRGRSHQDQGQDGSFSRTGQMVCYHCLQPGHMRRDCPQRQGSQGFGTA